MRNVDALLVTPVLMIGLGFLAGACSGASGATVDDAPPSSGAAPSSGTASSDVDASVPTIALPSAAQTAYAGAITTVSGAIGSDVNTGPACAMPVTADPPTQLCDVLSQIQGESHPYFFAGVRNDVTVPFADAEVSVDVVFDLQNLQAESFVRTSTSLDDNFLATGEDGAGSDGGIGGAISAQGQGYLGFAFGASADASLSSTWSTTFAAQATANAQASSFFSYDAEASAFCDPTQDLCGTTANADVCLNLDVDVSLPQILLSAALPGLPWDALTAQIAAHAHAQADASAQGSGTVGWSDDGGTTTLTGTGTGTAAADASAGASASLTFQPELVTMTDAQNNSFLQFAGGASLAYSLVDALGSSGKDAWFAAAVAIALDVQKQTGLSYAQLCGGDAGADGDSGAPIATASPGAGAAQTPIVVR
jgi:hypothetical protein